jgi:diguanylate cyclase (GGDEF)-like protein
MVEAALIAVALVAVAALAAVDGRRRLRDALRHVDDLEAERERVSATVDRLTRSLEGGLDRRLTLDIALGTTVDAVAAAAGRAWLVDSSETRTFEAVPVVPGAVDAEALLAAERAAVAGGEGREFIAGWWAIGALLEASRDAAPLGAIAVCRNDRAFSRSEEDLFRFLAAQTGASLEAIALHERLDPFRDELTGLANHRRFQELLEELVDESLRSGRALSLLLLDIDDFRTLNTTFGHGMGDEVLHAVAQAVRVRCGPSSEAARFSGQQIAVALPGSDLDAAWQIAEDVRAAVAELELPAGDEWLNVTASIGVVELSQRVASREGMIFAAEAALDEAKRAGKDRAVGFRGPYRTDDAWVRRAPWR